MKKTLTHLPENKKAGLENISNTIRELCNDVEMIILFGSYARGDWKEVGPTIRCRRRGQATHLSGNIRFGEEQ